MIHLPDPFTSHVDLDPLSLYVAGCERALRDARVLYAATALEEHGVLAVAASQALRRAKLCAWGVECPECDGDGDVPFDIMPATLTSPAEFMYRDCPTCRGEGLCLPPERDAYLSKEFKS